MTPYSRPDYPALYNRITYDLMQLPVLLREPLAAMWAQTCNSQHGHLDWVAAQCSPLTCELERLYDWAAVYGVSRLPGRAATGEVVFSGVPNTPLLAGVLFRGGNGLNYVTTAAGQVGGGGFAFGVSPIRCVTKGGAGNLIFGEQLVLIDPVAGIGSTATTQGGIGNAEGLTGGVDEELVDDWRLRVVEEWRNVTVNGARSGKPGDYLFWAKSAHPSVTGAIVLPHVLGIGSVVVYPICNGLVNRMPGQAVLDAVAAYYTSIAPAVADWRVAAPAIYPVYLTIHLQPAVDTLMLRTAIFDALNALVLANGGNGVSQLSWATLHATIAVLTAQYTLTEAGGIAWAAHEVPVLNFHQINWV